MKKTITLRTEGMHCKSCERLIEGCLKDKEGILDIRSFYERQETRVTFEDSKITENEIRESIKKEGYGVHEQGGKDTNNFSFVALALGLLTIGLSLYFIFGKNLTFNINEIDGNTSFLLLFLIGLMTGFHCIGMCGGFVLSYSSKKESTINWLSHLKYGAGKTISYTLIGALFGLFGSFFIFTTEMRAYAAVIAGIFLIIYGLNMLNIFSSLRIFHFSAPSFLTNFILNAQKKNNSPLYLGLLNGLMIACGPLQAMYLLAAGTGNPLIGGKLLLFFGLGTLLPLLGFGVVTNFLSKGLAHKIVRFSGVLVIIMGILMINNGLVLSGSALSLNTILQGTSSISQTSSNQFSSGENFQTIYMNVTQNGWEPNTFVLKKGVPVKWIINGKELTGCNSEIVVGEYGLRIPVHYGEQIIEFTPDKEGVVRWSCWMGMIQGMFIVTDDEVNKEEVDEIVGNAGGLSSSSGCGCGGKKG